MYSLGGLSQMDQPVAKFEMSMSSFLLNMWWQRASIEWSSFVQLSVVDYAYLTDITVIDPVNVQVCIL